MKLSLLKPSSLLATAGAALQLATGQVNAQQPVVLDPRLTHSDQVTMQVAKNGTNSAAAFQNLRTDEKTVVGDLPTLTTASTNDLNRVALAGLHQVPAGFAPNRYVLYPTNLTSASWSVEAVFTTATNITAVFKLPDGSLAFSEKVPCSDTSSLSSPALQSALTKAAVGIDAKELIVNITNAGGAALVPMATPNTATTNSGAQQTLTNLQKVLVTPKVTVYMQQGTSLARQQGLYTAYMHQQGESVQADSRELK